MNFNKGPLLRIQRERLALAKRKNRDYSSRIDNVGLQGLEGIAVALLNKSTRLFSLVLGRGSAAIKSEKVRDTLMDAGNYADFGVALSDGTWQDVTSNRRHSRGHKSHPR